MVVLKRKITTVAIRMNEARSQSYTVGKDGVKFIQVEDVTRGLSRVSIYLNNGKIKDFYGLGFITESLEVK